MITIHGLLRSLRAGFLLFLATLMLAACGTGIGESTNPALELSPTAMTFSQVAIGDGRTQELNITNGGDGTLTVRDIELVNDDGQAFSPEGTWPQTIELEPSESQALAVRYEPAEAIDYSATISMATNDPDRPEATVAVTTQGIGGELFVNPPVVDFPQTPPDSEDYQFVTIANVGSAPLDIEDIELVEGDDVFAISFPEDRTAAAATDSDRPPAMLAHDDEPILMRVVFEPRSIDPARGTVKITTNDAYEPEFKLPLRGNSGDPCLDFSHADGLAFGPAAIGEDNRRVVTLRNCSPSSDLAIDALEINDSDGIFSLHTDSLPDELIDGGTATLAPGEVTTAQVSFRPVDESDYTADLVVNSDDPNRTQVVVPLSGHGVDGQCPEARATGSIDGTPPTDTVAAAPQDMVALSAAESTDPDGTDLTYEWSVIARPSGSLADVDSPTAEETAIELDIVGPFLVELTVTDELGLTNCEPAVVDIFATPTEDIHIELVWRTSVVDQSYGGPDAEEEIGVDLDLHYVHPEADWGDPDWSVNFLHRDEDWGDHGQVTLDIDDQWGQDPENINHTDPLNGAFYRVGVHYYSDNGFGATDATVRIYFGIDLYGQYDRRLHSTDNFWYVGNIQWNTDTPTVVVFDDFQNSIDAINSRDDF